MAVLPDGASFQEFAEYVLARRDVPLLMKKMGFGIEIIKDESHCLSMIITKTN